MHHLSVDIVLFQGFVVTQHTSTVDQTLHVHGNVDLLGDLFLELANGNLKRLKMFSTNVDCFVVKISKISNLNILGKRTEPAFSKLEGATLLKNHEGRCLDTLANGNV